MNNIFMSLLFLKHLPWQTKLQLKVATAVVSAVLVIMPISVIKNKNVTNTVQ